MADLAVLDQDIKELAVVRFLINVISTDNTKSMYFERDLYDIVNRNSAYIDRIFCDIKYKLHPAAMITGRRVLRSTGAAGIDSSDEHSDSGQFVPDQMPISDTTDNNNGLYLDPLNLAGSNNNQSPSGTNVQTTADYENPAVNQVMNVNDANKARQRPNEKVICTDFLAEIAKRTEARNGQNPEAVRVYVGREPAADPVASRDRILTAVRAAIRYLTWRCSHAYGAKFSDYMKIKASNDRHLIDRQICKLKKFIDWLEGTKFSRGHGTHRKTGNQYDQTKLERKANDAGVVVVQEASPGREFSTASTTDMLRLKKHLLNKLKGQKYKNFDHIFEREFKNKFKDGTFTQKQGDEFVNGLFKLFRNCLFYKAFDLGALVSVNSDSDDNLIMLGPEALEAVTAVDLVEDGYLRCVIALENRDLLKKYFDKFNKTVKKNQNRRLTPSELCILASNENIPIKFAVQRDPKTYRNNVAVYSETNSSQGGSLDPGQKLTDLSEKYDKSNGDLSILKPEEPGDSDNIDCKSNSILSTTGSGSVGPTVEDSSFNKKKLMASLESDIRELQNMMAEL